MPAILGKRKRRKEVSRRDEQRSSGADLEEDEQLRRLLRHHFETKFEALEPSGPGAIQRTPQEEDLDAIDSGNETDWTGFSGDEEQLDAVVVDYQNLEKAKAGVSRKELKLFMTARPPLQSNKATSTVDGRGTEPADPDEVATDVANLKNDLALQRLLKESHLLDPKLSSAPSGQSRHKALDIRQQTLGSKSSLFSQQSMPLAQRRGILAKAAERDEKRRREAKENGIILEKAMKSRARDRQRQRGIGAPSVGKFSRGILTLSKKDVAEIVGPSKRARRK
ncbi:MAG: hypothetical protein Q9201_001850 [Fulgogasparrea decipioides]